MSTIEINGYLDDEVFWGDEMTPEMLKEQLDGTSGDVTVRIHSYGGSCAAATRMYDMLRDYAGTVNVIISGVAASAASVLAMAGDRVEMTPGSLLMAHNPSCIAWGEERDLEDAIQLLRATKDSIVNIYVRKSGLNRKELAKMMDATTWMDAEEALEKGFIDGITGDIEQLEEVQPENVDAIQSPSPSALKAVACIDRREAEAKVRAWVDRQKPQVRLAARQGDTAPENTLPSISPPTSQPNIIPAPAAMAGVSHEQLSKRLSLLRH